MKNKLIKDLNELKDRIQLIMPGKAEEYQGWIDKITEGVIVSPKLREWLLNQANYEREKNREYAEFLYQVAKD